MSIIRNEAVDCKKIDSKTTNLVAADWSTLSHMKSFWFRTEYLRICFTNGESDKFCKLFEIEPLICFPYPSVQFVDCVKNIPMELSVRVPGEVFVQPSRNKHCGKQTVVRKQFRDIRGG